MLPESSFKEPEAMETKILSRGEFLGATAFAALGLTPAAAAAQAERRRGHVVAITHGPSDLGRGR